MEELRCKFCGKSCKNLNSLKCHERLCPSNPDRIYVSHTKGLKPWNTGKNKETDVRLKEKGISLSEKFRSGELIHSWKGKHHSEETKLKISKSMIKAQKEGRAYNIGQCRWNNKHSWPEQWLIEVLKNEFQMIEHIDYETEYSFGRFSLDFAWPNRKICIEVDGKQHDTDEAQKIRDKAKDLLLKDDGWKELRIPWLKCYKTPQFYIDEIKKLLGV